MAAAPAQAERVGTAPSACPPQYQRRLRRSHCRRSRARRREPRQAVRAAPSPVCRRRSHGRVPPAPSAVSRSAGGFPVQAWAPRTAFLLVRPRRRPSSRRPALLVLSATTRSAVACAASGPSARMALPRKPRRLPSSRRPALRVLSVTTRSAVACGGRPTARKAHRRPHRLRLSGIVRPAPSATIRSAGDSVAPVQTRPPSPTLAMAEQTAFPRRRHRQPSLRPQRRAAAPARSGTTRSVGADSPRPAAPAPRPRRRRQPIRKTPAWRSNEGS